MAGSQFFANFTTNTTTTKPAKEVYDTEEGVPEGLEDAYAGLARHDDSESGGEGDELLSKATTLIGTPEGAVRSAYFNTVCMMMGVGVLGLPATIAKAGWVMLGVIPVLIVMAAYSGRLLVDLLYHDCERGGEKLAGYPEVGWRAMGWFGVGATHFSMKTTLLTVSGVMAYLGSTLAKTAIIDMYYGHAGAPANLDQDAVTKHAVMMFCAASLVPTLLLPALREVSLLSAFGALATVGVAIICLVVGFNDHGAHGGHDVFVSDKFGNGLGTIVLGLGGASTMPSIERQMSASFRQPAARTYKNVVVGVFGTLACVYIPVAFSGYYVYGATVEGLILDSLPKHGVYLAIISALNTALALHCFVTHSLIIFVLAEEFERRVFGIEQAKMRCAEHLLSWHTAPRLIARLSCVGWTFCIAYFVPNFLALCDLTGSFCVFSVYILPCLFTLALDYQRDPEERGLGWPRRVWIVLLMIVASLGFYFGFKAAILEVRDAFSN